MSEQMQSGSDVQLKVAGQEFNVKNVKSLNTLLTFFGFAASVLILYMLWMHQQDQRDSGAAFVGALKEQTTAIREGTAAQREQTCMLKFNQDERKANADWCKQVAGVR